MVYEVHGEERGKGRGTHLIHCWGLGRFYICSQPAAVLVASAVAVAVAAAVAGVEIVVKVEVEVVVKVTGVDIEHAPDNVVH